MSTKMEMRQKNYRICRQFLRGKCKVVVANQTGLTDTFSIKEWLIDGFFARLQVVSVRYNLNTIDWLRY